MNEQHNGRTALHLLLETLLAAMGVYGSVFCLCTAFHIAFLPLLWGLIPAICLLICLLCRAKKGGLICLIIGLVFLAACFLLRRPLLRWGRALWLELAARYDKGYVLVDGLYDREAVHDAAAAARFLIPLAILEAYFASLSVSRWKSTAACLVSVLPCIAPCFVLIDTPPKLWALFLVVASLLIQLFSQSSRRREPRETGLALLWGGVITAVALTALILLFPPQRYKTPMTWEKLNEKLEELTARWENRNNERAGLSGNPSAIHLKDLRSLPDSPLKVLRVETDFTGRLYLRGTAYEGFDGQNWTRLTGRDWDDPAIVYPSLLFPRYKADSNDIQWSHDAAIVVVAPDDHDSSSFARRDPSVSSTFLVTPTVYAPGAAYSLTVRPISRADNSVVYVPYYPLNLPQSAALVSDSHLKNKRPSASYELDFTRDVNLLSEISPDYTQYVLDTCLKLPDGEREALRTWLAEHGHNELLGNGLDPYERAERIVALVSVSKEYSRKSTAAPRGKDFVLWFLDEAESGYCVHFATTTTALLRAVDVPARYVSGYVCRTEAGKKTTVTSLNAHAWVEIFIDGSWRPIDPTPGHGERSDPPPTEAPTTTEPPAETVVPTDEPTHHRPNIPTETRVRPVPTEQETQPEDPSTTATPVPPPPPDTPQRPGFPKWVWIPIGLVAFIVLLVLRRFLAIRLRLKRQDRAVGNDKAILLYRRCTKLCRILHLENTEEVEYLGNKAAFSQHVLTEEEMEGLYHGVLFAETRLRCLSFWKRLYYEYIRAII